MHSAGVVQQGTLESCNLHAYGAHLLHNSSLIMATATLEEGVGYDFGLELHWRVIADTVMGSFHRAGVIQQLQCRRKLTAPSYQLADCFHFREERHAMRGSETQLLFPLVCLLLFAGYCRCPWLVCGFCSAFNSSLMLGS